MVLMSQLVVAGRAVGPIVADNLPTQLFAMVLLILLSSNVAWVSVSWARLKI